MHESTVLPTVQLSDFKDKLTGESHHHGADSHQHKFFQGEPKGSNAAPSEGKIGHHGGAATIDSKVGGHHHQSSAQDAERI